MKKPLVSDMPQDEFMKIFVNCIRKEDLADFVMKADIKDFCTRKEIEMIAEQASEHSTKRIETTIEKVIPEALEKEIPKAMDSKLLKIGINPDHSIEMQDIMSFVRKMKKNHEDDRASVRSALIKNTIKAIGVILVFLIGVSTTYFTLKPH